MAIASTPAGAEILLGAQSLGFAPVTVTLPPGSSELTARFPGMPTRRHTVAVVEGEETALSFNLKSGGSSSSGHRRHTHKPPPSELGKIGESIKAFFSGGASTAKSHHTRHSSSSR